MSIRVNRAIDRYGYDECCYAFHLGIVCRRYSSFGLSLRFSPTSNRLCAAGNAIHPLPSLAKAVCISPDHSLHRIDRSLQRRIFAMTLV
jgi:hypothetical protein